MRGPSESTRRGAIGIAVVLISATGAASCERAPEGVPAIRGALDLDPSVVIRQVYGGGSNAGAPFTHDFIELFNRGDAPASLGGWSLQYASATGTGTLGANASQLTELPAVILAVGQSFLVQEAGGTVGAALPAPDLVDPTPINLGATAGKVALVRAAAGLGCNGGSVPCGAAEDALIVDLVGYGNTNFFETAAAPAPGNALGARRGGGGCIDSNNNATDFSVAAPEPRNTASAISACGGGAGGAAGMGSDGGGGAGGTGGSGTGGANTGGAGGAPTPGTTRIHDIQGRAHRSPLEGMLVTNVPGIVTQVRSNGFVMQDPAPDADPSTSEGVFVFTGTASTVAAGDAVLVSGPVAEFRPGCTGNCPPSSSGYPNLTTTEIDRPSLVFVVSAANPLPEATLIGPGGRTPPGAAADDDGVGDVESPAAVFSPDSDGLDFYESLEAMRVEVRDAVVVGPTNNFGEIPVLAAGGAGAGSRSARGGIVLGASDVNPERIFLDGAAMPAVSVGDTFAGSTFAVVDYTFGNFKFDTTALAPLAPGGLTREVVSLGGARAANQLDVAAFNVENLDPSDPPAKFAALAQLITTNLGAPDIVALEEVQDDNGASNDGVVSAAATLQTLIAAVQAAGGPTYQARSIDPADDQDGGEPGGNIRVAFLYRTDRGLTFVDRPGASATTANSVVNNGGVPSLAFSPGRIAPTNAAFANSRKPLAGEFHFNGRTLFVVANHFNSKGGDQPLFGRFQPPVQSSQTQRLAQAQVVAGFVGQVLAVDPAAAIVVLGDLNDFEFSPPVATLKTAGLTDLIETLPANQRYTYVFEGNSQVLDHVMASPGLAALAGFDVVHVNAEFADQVSDHDPAVARFSVGALPARRLVPVLECVVRQGALSWMARFGYENPNALTVDRPTGSNNRFVLEPINRGQPTTFLPGRQRAVLQVPFRPLQPAVWLLDGRLAAATILSPRCP